MSDHEDYQRVDDIMHGVELRRASGNIITDTLQQRLYVLMADAGALVPNHTWPDGVLDDLIVGWVQELQGRATLAGTAQQLTHELEFMMQTATDLRAQVDSYRHKAEQYDDVVKTIGVADNGQYRNDTIESLLARLRKAENQLHAQNAVWKQTVWNQEANRWDDLEDTRL